MSLEQELIARVSALERRMDNLAQPERETRESASWRGSNSLYMALMGLRGLWPMSCATGSGQAADLSGQARHLTAGGALAAGTDGFSYDGLAPYYHFGGACYLTRADEAGLDILGTEVYFLTGRRGLTIGGWFYPEDVATDQGLMSKYDPAGNDRAYYLSLRGTVAGDPIRFYISDDGTNFDSVDSASAPTANTWQFCAGRYNDSLAGAELSVWLNDEQTTGATARNSINNSAAPFNIGGYNNGSGLYTGSASLCFLCAAALSDDQVYYLYQYTRSLFGV